MMRAVRVSVDASKALLWEETARPVRKASEVVIKVLATAVNRADLSQRAGRYPPPPGATDILGLECSGEVIEAGPDAWCQAGTKVCALLPGGGYAEYVACEATHCLPFPPGITSPVEAAAVVEAYTTAYLNVFMEGGLKKNETALIHAGASSVGLAAIQLCKAMGNPVYATVGSADKIAACVQHGATAAFNRHDGPWLEQLKGVKADVILCPVGANYLQDNIAALNKQGRVVIIGLLGGAAADAVPTNQIMVKRIRVIGSVLRSRSIEEKNAILAELKEKVWPLFAQAEHKLRPVVYDTIPLPEVARAYAIVEKNENIGKVVLTNLPQE